jgi:thiol-disulfide isomerase/thioredoxin
MKFLKNYIETKKKESLWSKITDILMILLIVGLIIPTTRTPILVFFKQITNFSPSVSAEDDYGKLSSNDYLWTLVDEKGQQVRLEQFGDKPIFINFWATWCAPCLAEMPSIAELQKEFGTEVHFIFISYEDFAKTTPLLLEKQWDFKTYFPANREPKILQSNSLPTTFIIDKNGKIVVRETGNKKWSGNSVKELLRELIKQN